jgi:hypothetical protein
VKVAEKIWRAGADKKAPYGSKPWNTEVMVRVFALKRLNNPSEEKWINNCVNAYRSCASFGSDWVTRCRKAGPSGCPPTSRRKRMEPESCLLHFNRQLAERGLLVKEGVTAEATFMAVPRQRNSRKRTKNQTGRKV